MDDFKISSKINNSLIIILIISIIGFLMVAIRVTYTDSIKNTFLIWNLFLAWIPVIAAISIINVYKNNSLNSLFKITFYFFVGLIWLLFYPNAPYLVTDLIHISIYDYYTSSNQFAFNYDFIAWYDLILFFVFAWLGILLGFIALYLVQQIIKNRWKPVASWGFVIFVLSLTGFGIYLGRFVRFNSWDLFYDPHWLVIEIISYINFYSFVYSALFAIIQFLPYITLYILANDNKGSGANF